MSIKKILAAVSVCMAAAVSLAAMSFTTTAETDIAYTGPSAGALATGDNGTDIRLNIFNEWGNNVKDINNTVTAEKNITVTFTISGLGSHTTNVDDAGNPTTAYEAVLNGAMGGNTFWGKPDDTVTCTPVPITGDGQYTLTFPLKEATGSIECLLIQTNINMYQLDVQNPATVADCGVTIKVDSIKADADVTQSGGNNTSGGNTTPTTANGTQSAGGAATTTANGSTGGTVTTTANNSGSALGNSTQVNSASTGDKGVTIAVAGLVITAAAAAVTQIKRKK